MKKLLVILAITLFVFACNSSDTGEKKAPEQKAVDTPASSGQPTVANEKGLELIGASDCTTCHQIDKKITGPAYRDVANKYEATDAVIDTLVNKIIKGGQGVWGTIPMVPHPNITEADAKEMVKYILSLRNK